jgi:hypothetical protein
VLPQMHGNVERQDSGPHFTLPIVMAADVYCKAVEDAAITRYARFSGEKRQAQWECGR